MATFDVDYSKWTIPKDLRKELDTYKGQITTRFPPEPSGYLHIGHLKAMFINTVVAKVYNGTLIFRFDDTNPDNETDEYEKAILEDFLKFVEPSRITHTSDYFDEILKYADWLVDNHLAYVDDTDPDTMSHERKQSIESKNRNNSVEVNQQMWNEMKNGERKSSVLRLKFDMTHKTSTIRDPSIYRYVESQHLHTKDKFKVFPMYDFSCPIVDILEGVTHVFRSSEFSDRDLQYNMIIDVLKLRHPFLYSYGKINVQGTVMSKRKIKALIESGKLEGWDDPRLLTVRGVLKRGLDVNSLIDFIAKTGFSKNEVDLEGGTIWGHNRKYVDKIATKYVAISNNYVDVIVEGDNDIVLDILKVPRNTSVGSRPLYRSSKILIEKEIYDQLIDGEEVTLMNWGNMFWKNGQLVPNLTGDPKTTKHKIFWIHSSKYVPLTLKNYSNNMEDPVEIVQYIGEDHMKTLKVGDKIELMRLNYYICDKQYDETVGDPLVLISLPYVR